LLESKSRQNKTPALIGLKNNTVRVVPYCPEWAELFIQEAQFIRDNVGDMIIGIEHVGSTAVPGLSAKPILDIAIAVRSKDGILSVVKGLMESGYIDMGDQGDDGGYLLAKYSEPEMRICHLHIVEISDVQWWNYITFRDILRRDPAIRDKYAQLKKRLAQQFADDRDSYMDGKNKFIREVLNNEYKS
jgi:GrpB-like predicted nucleotidyltransferase (UPF0157 family)